MGSVLRAGMLMMLFCSGNSFAVEMGETVCIDTAYSKTLRNAEDLGKEGEFGRITLGSDQTNVSKSISDHKNALTWQISRAKNGVAVIQVSEKKAGVLAEVSGTCYFPQAKLSLALPTLGRRLECDCSSEYDDVR